MKYKVSIILPCYNVALYIETAIKSILKQTFKNYEVIFINDGSTDDTLKIIEKYCSSDNFNVYSYCNQGVAQARNEGINLAKGEYLFFMDPDDYIDERLLETALNACEKFHADAVQFHYECDGTAFNGNKGSAVFNGSQILDDLLPRFIGYSNKDIQKFGTPEFYDSNEWAAVWRFLFKTSVVKENLLLFPRGVKMSEDRFFILLFFCYAQRVVTIENKLYHYIIHPNGCMTQGLINPKSLLKNKIDGVVERGKLRNLLMGRHKRDVFSLYSGSLSLSCLELFVKLSYSDFIPGWKGIREYLRFGDVKKAIRQTIKNAPPKVKIPLLCIRCHLGFFMFSILWLIHFYRSSK